VEPIPGAVAAIAALSASGFEEPEVLFVGFPPSRSSDRKKWLARLADERRVLLLYEAPHRIEGTLRDMLDAWGDRVVAMARELTKAHEELVVRPISAHLSALGVPRGEFTLVVKPAMKRSDSDVQRPPDSELAAEFGELTNLGLGSRREVLKLLSAKYDISSKELYAIIERHKNSAG
jgi:16S rRNA (cytidine1402-2'-O)-methyltransferase